MTDPYGQGVPPSSPAQPPAQPTGTPPAQQPAQQAGQPPAQGSYGGGPAPYPYPGPAGGVAYPAGEPGQVGPRPNRAKPFVLAGAGLLALFVLVLGGLAVWDVVREDSGVTACRSLAAKTTASGQDRLTEAEYQELREQFADSDIQGLQEHGTEMMDLIWQVTRTPDQAGMDVLSLLPAISAHALRVQSACAAHGVEVQLDIRD